MIFDFYFYTSDSREERIKQCNTRVTAFNYLNYKFLVNNYIT